MAGPSQILFRYSEADLLFSGTGAELASEHSAADGNAALC